MTLDILDILDGSPRSSNFRKFQDVHGHEADAAKLLRAVLWQLFLTVTGKGRKLGME